MSLKFISGWTTLISVPSGGNDGYFSLRYRVHTGSETHIVSYPMGTGGSFPGFRVTGAWSRLLTSI